MTAHLLEDGTVRVVLRETSVLRAIQRISAYADHLERVEEPDELRRHLKAAFEHALGHLDD